MLVTNTLPARTCLIHADEWPAGAMMPALSAAMCVHRVYSRKTLKQSTDVQEG